MIAALLCLIASVTDGDTLRCGDGTRLRLAAIDSPELPGHCRPGRNCAPGDPYAARANLRRLAPEGSTIRYSVVDANQCHRGFDWTDRYGRYVVRAWNGAGVELGAAQLAGGFAVRWFCGNRHG
jgi:micrococcal nuclease